MARILVVEDSPTVVYLLGDALAQDGYDVLKATDGAEALRIAREEELDLVLLDVILPKVNGFQVCRMLKEGEHTAHLPVVMITSKAKTKDRMWGLEQGADAYVTKPVDRVELLDVVHKFVRQPS